MTATIAQIRSALEVVVQGSVAAFEGPFVDHRGPYVLAAFSDTGAKDPMAERLPKLIRLRPTDGGGWADIEQVIKVTPGALGLTLALEPPFRV